MVLWMFQVILYRANDKIIGHSYSDRASLVSGRSYYTDAVFVRLLGQSLHGGPTCMIKDQGSLNSYIAQFSRVLVQHAASRVHVLVACSTCCVSHTWSFGHLTNCKSGMHSSMTPAPLARNQAKSGMQAKVWERVPSRSPETTRKRRRKIHECLSELNRNWEGVSEDLVICEC